ncbi:3'-kinase, partial [Escherichia coli]|nr:3'-kinase [Escherichia coli]ELO2931834.1 3'-kinase [Escherichia coli]
MFMPPVFPAHWHVSQPVLIADTFSSLVWKVSLPDGTPAIVKGLKPIEDIADGPQNGRNGDGNAD